MLRWYGEARMGGYTDADGTVAFYGRVHAILPPDAVVADVGCGRGCHANDPVPFRRVLRMAFELHDMFGSKGRAEEAHFAGLPGVRVLIHEVAPDAPRSDRLRGYPEPEYRTVGRARILHVFRDRGEVEDPVDSPRSRRGAPLGV